MAKKAKKTEKVEVEPQVEKMEEVVTEFFEETVTAKPKRVEKKNPKLEDGWELKDRIYRLKGNKKPISRSIRSANIHWFDEKKVTKENLNIVKTKKQFLLMK